MGRGMVRWPHVLKINKSTRQIKQPSKANPKSCDVEKSKMCLPGNSLHANTSFLGISQHDEILPLFVLPFFFAVSAVFLKVRGVKASGGPATEDRT